MNTAITFAENSQLVGHSLKLNKTYAKKSIKLHSFVMRTISVWKSLPSKIISSTDVVEFERNRTKYGETSSTVGSDQHILKYSQLTGNDDN